MFFGLFKGAKVAKDFSNGAELNASVSAEVTEDLHVRLNASVEIDLVAEAKKLAAKTNTPIDDAAVAWLEKIVVASKAA